jgi:hypothetical protein
VLPGPPLGGGGGGGGGGGLYTGERPQGHHGPLVTNYFTFIVLEARNLLKPSQIVSGTNQCKAIKSFLLKETTAFH